MNQNNSYPYQSVRLQGKKTSFLLSSAVKKKKIPHQELSAGATVGGVREAGERLHPGVNAQSWVSGSLGSGFLQQ